MIELIVELVRHLGVLAIMASALLYTMCQSDLRRRPPRSIHDDERKEGL